MTQVSDYLSLITSEHQKPNFLAMVSVLAQWAVDRQALLQSIRGTEAVPGSITLDVVPSADASFYRTDWQGRQLLYATPRTNGLTYSQAFENAIWNGNGITITPAAIVAPDGTLTGEKIADNTTASAAKNIEQGVTGLSTMVPYAHSVHAQAAEYGYLLLRLIASNNTNSYAYAVFNLATGTPGVSGVVGGATGLTTEIEELEDGWYRCSMTAVPDSGGTTTGVSGLIAAQPTNSNGNVRTGVVGSGCYAWGADLKPGTLSGYIPTTTAPVTVTDYAVNDSGLVTLGQIPAAAAQITWSGDATVIENGGPVQASNALLGVGNGALSQFQAALTWGTQVGTPEIPGLYDIDIAVGQQLDRIGEWVGISRQLAIPLTNVYFSFDETGLGFDQGTWLGPFDPTTGLVSLPDDVYRILLYAKIAANTWDGTIPTAYTAWNTIFEPLGYQILIQNNQDMTMDIALIGPAPDAVTLALFSGGYLSLIPAGVGVNNYYLQSVQNAPLFGFDAQNDSIAGFDTGAFAQILQ